MCGVLIPRESLSETAGGKHEGLFAQGESWTATEVRLGGESRLRGTAARSADRHRQLAKPREGGGELLGPGPAALQAQGGATGMKGKPTGGVQGAVAQPLGLKPRKLAAQDQGVGQGEEQLGD